jgi:hypothetical protein
MVSADGICRMEDYSLDLVLLGGSTDHEPVRNKFKEREWSAISFR